MFTGLIQKVGVLKRISRGRGLVLEFAFDPWQSQLEKGESVAVNGVCLTVAQSDNTRFTADVLDETANRTCLSSLLPGQKVNLERAVRAGEPLGGHIVQGHVDCRGKVVAIENRGRDKRLRVKCGPVAAAQTVLKGSVALNGVSLTVTELGADYLSVDIIPVTLSETTLGLLKVGDELNIETDVLGKYAAKRAPASSLTFEALASAGFIN